MSALRVAIESASSEFNDTLPDIVLDCWKAEVHIGLDASAVWAINGQALPAPIYAQLAAGAQCLPLVYEFGGMMDRNERPVNMNTVLEFANVAGGARLCQYVVIKTYFDPNLPDPQR